MRKLPFYLLTTFTVFFAFQAIAQTPGQLSVTVTTSDAGGSYKPKNIVAVWVEDDQGNFVKTLLAYAQSRITHLNTWEASTTAAGVAFDRTDAVTGATQSSHGERSCTWDGTDYTGSPVSGGEYYIWMELTDKNGTGNYSSFAVTIGSDAATWSPANEPSFWDITLNWEPTGSINTPTLNSKPVYTVFPNPADDALKIEGSAFDVIEIRSFDGKLIKTTESLWLDISNLPTGNYLLYIKNGNHTTVKKIVKQ